MNAIKWVTQRITGLIYWPIAILVIPFALAKIGQVLGLWSAIDSAYLLNPWMFWISLVVSRAVYAAACIFLDIGFHKVGKATGFFWFAEEREYYSSRPDPVDQSSYIIGGFAAICVLLCVAEFAIRVSTWTNPPYLPPPAH